MSYTIEDFKLEVSNSETPDEINNALLKALDSKDIDITDPDNKEIILEYKNQLKDLKDSLNIEEDKVCNDLIESGKLELYLCKKDYLSCKSGNRYYLKVDDVKSFYIEKVKEISDRLDPEVLNRINSMRPLITAITDDGIGTLKKRTYLKIDLEEYFEKI